MPDDPRVVRSADSQTRSLPFGSAQWIFLSVTHLQLMSLSEH